MKTIAVSVDEPTLAALDRFARTAPPDRPGLPRRRSPRRRSELVRKALHEFLARNEQAAVEAGEKKIYARHRHLVAQQAAALVAEQRRT